MVLHFALSSIPVRLTAQSPVNAATSKTLGPESPVDQNPAITGETIGPSPAPEPLGVQDLIDTSIALAILAGLSLAVLALTRMIVMPLLRHLIKRTKFEWDDVFLDAKTFRWISYIFPAVVFALATEILQSRFNPIDIVVRPAVLSVMQQLAYPFIVVCMLMAVNASLTAVNTIYRRKAVARARPIKGYIQLAKIFVATIGSICAIALLFDREPWEFLKYSAGMTAVLLFVFKDTILSLVASIQLTSNDMLQVGDWIEVPSCNADGDVIDVALHTVKVRNFDKTIVTVPTRSLVEGAFKNWRGMQESGGRRIKRTLYIDQSTIRFLDDSDINRLEKIDAIRGYLADKKQQVAETNAQRRASEVSLEVGLNSRRLTNIGTFRAYLTSYLRSIPNIHGEYTFLVRQMQPTIEGLPIQIYMFTDTTKWAEYESIQSDIFDHLLAAIPEFGLRLFQKPSGQDVVDSGPAGAA